MLLVACYVMPVDRNKQPEILSERFQRQETITLGEALFLIDQVSHIKNLVYTLPCVSFNTLINALDTPEPT